MTSLMSKRRPCPDLRMDVATILRYVCDRSSVADNGCWIWKRHKNSLGYAVGSYKNRVWTITRLVYCATQGAFDPTLDLCHRCDNPSCVNPHHVFLGTAKDNAVDSREKGRHFTSSKTECPRGHSYAEHAYTSAKTGRRSCRICHNARFRIRAGWPPELAYSLAPTPHGYTPVKADWQKSKRQRTGIRPQDKVNCKNGHPLSGDNLYVVPRTGHRQCKTCRHAVVRRIASERAASNGPGSQA